MSTDEPRAECWARFRLAVVGTLLASPPEHGHLRAALLSLSHKRYEHPISGEPMRIGFSTLEAWYYAALRGDNPFTELRRKVRKDAGVARVVSARVLEVIGLQYAQHPSWSYKLHYKNLQARAEGDATLLPLPSYPTLRRAMKAQGLVRRKRRTDYRVEHGPREVRSYEKAHAHALWHLDFHHAKRNVLLPDGSYVTPKLFAVLDDHSRVCCHAQWYLDEGAEQLVHGLIQALCKRGLPRAILMDNGAAMVAAETAQGLSRLGIVQCFTQAESPHQNGKQEHFFAPVEGQLMAMLEGVADLDLELLNRATLAWVEGDYHRNEHRELGETPLSRLAGAPSVGRPAPGIEQLRDAFRLQAKRKQRRSDGTCSIEGVRFEIPAHYRHIEWVTVRYARFDLGRVSMVDPRHGHELCRLRPLDKRSHASGHRAALSPPHIEPLQPSGIAPHLERLIAQYERAGRPPAYLPEVRHSTNTPEETE